MRSFFFSAIALALVCTVYTVSTVDAQSRAAAGPPAQIAVVDISYIFKHYGRFQQQMEGMKTQVETAEKTLKKERDTITAKMESLKDYKPGSPNYSKLEEEITHNQADFNARASLQKKEFLERESGIYMQVYREVNDAVKYVADQRGHVMVLRFNGDPADPNNRESVLREINKPIVYQRDVDITPFVLDELNRGNVKPAARTNTANGGGGVAPVGPPPRR